MRSKFTPKLEDGRIKGGFYASKRDDSCGAFVIQGPCGAKLAIVSSGSTNNNPYAEGFEHVSVSAERRIPNWLEMSFVKDLFWEDEELVVQFHPPKSVYVNCHPYTLHLWRDVTHPVRVPPTWMV